ncbi:MAG: hypothetical protein ACK4GU_17035, partial [Alishewanella aestuarii]
MRHAAANVAAAAAATAVAVAVAVAVADPSSLLPYPCCAQERFNAAHERVEKQAPVLQHSIAQLQKGQETLREQTGRVSGRVRALHEELAGVQHDISALAQHCATAAENYAEDTEKRTVQRHAVREL